MIILYYNFTVNFTILIFIVAGYLPGEVADHDHIIIRFDPKCYIQLFTSGIVINFAAIKFWYLVLQVKGE